MELVILLAALLILGLMLLPLLVGGVAIRSGRSRRHAEANADEVLRDLLDGSPQVTYRETLGGLSADTVTRRAAEYGYRVTSVSDSKAGKTLILTRS